MNNTNTRHPYSLNIKLDPRSQDQLKWLEIALKWLAPDVKLSNAVLIRRAITAYVERLENITGPAERHNGPSQMGEAAKVMGHYQPQPVYWPNGVFPEVIGEDGRPMGYRFLEGQHRSASQKRGMDSLLKGGKTGKGV